MAMFQEAFQFSELRSTLMSLERSPEKSIRTLQEGPSHTPPPLPKKKRVFMPGAVSGMRGQPDASGMKTGTTSHFHFYFLLKFWKSGVRMTTHSP